MKIAVLLKEVVDLVEEIVVDGSQLDRDELAFRSNEFDDYALVEALEMKGEGDTVDVYALDGDQAESMLHLAVARGANNLFKVQIDGTDFEEGISSRTAANGFAKALEGANYDLVMTGVQGVDDLDGSIAAHVGQIMGVPNLNVVIQVDQGEGSVTCMKEFSGGVIGEYEVQLPAVIGVQASRSPPSYIPVSKVRRAAQDATITDKSVSVGDVKLGKVSSVALPSGGDKAEMISGEPGEQAAKVLEILKSRGILS
ncbi:MAG: electron transfer flavoprotein subunit beta/FixA family protein [Candidatus Kariarchaeaceae archaeon]|jgi:electron transfer flavoprotein beta subunit